MMDKRLLDALNNLSESLDLISQTLSEKKAESPTAKALEGGNFSVQIREISEGVKKLQSDNITILKNQETIIALSKKKDIDSKTSSFQTAGDMNTQKAIKSGVSVILLIATGVLAMGLAFKLIGNVDFLSVVGLSIAIVLISVAFEKVAKLKMTTKDALQASLVLVMISGAITVSSWILALIAPIGFTQLITAVAISTMFTLISINLEKMAIGINSFTNQKVNPLDLVKTFLGVSTAITLSSFILKGIVPLSFGQLITAVFISVVFAAISINLEKMAKGVKEFTNQKVNPMDLVLSLVAISTAITASSFILKGIVPLSFGQLITAVFISAIFAVISFNLEKMAKGVKTFQDSKINPLNLVLTLVAISTAITASSWILSLSTPIPFGNLLNLLALSVVLSIAAITIGLAALVLAKIGISNIIKGSLGIIVIAGAIMISSLILNLGSYKNYPSLDWAMGVGLSLLAFTPAIVALGLLAMTGIGAIAILTGGAMALLVAATIVGSSYILATGSYEKFPSTDWSAGVGLSLLAFGTGMIALGLLAITGIGALAILAGSSMVQMVANTIVSTSEILSKGVFDVGRFPSDKWISGATTLLYGVAMVAVSLAFLLPLITLGTLSILTVVGTIVSTSIMFDKGKFDENKFPSDKWISGATTLLYGMSMTAISMAFLLPLIILGSFAILSVAYTIKKIDDVLSQGTFKNFPSKNWSDGVSNSIMSFVNLMSNVSFGSILSGNLANLFGGGVIDVVDMMVLVARKITSAGAVWATNINPNFMSNLGKNIMSYVQLAKFISGNVPGKKGGIIGSITSVLFGKDSAEDPMERVVSGMVKLGNAYVKLSQSIQKFGNAINGIDPEKLSSIKAFTSNIVLMSIMDPVMFESMLDKLEKKAGVFVNIIDDINDANEQGEKKLKGVSSGVTTNNIVKKPDPTQQQILQVLASMDAKLGTIARNSNTLADYTNELRTGQGVKIKK